MAHGPETRKSSPGWSPGALRQMESSAAVPDDAGRRAGLNSGGHRATSDLAPLGPLTLTTINPATRGRAQRAPRPRAPGRGREASGHPAGNGPSAVPESNHRPRARPSPARSACSRRRPLARTLEQDAHRGTGRPVKGATRSSGRPPVPLTGSRSRDGRRRRGRAYRGHLPPGAEERGPRHQEQEQSRSGAAARCSTAMRAWSHACQRRGPAGRRPVTERA